MKILNREQLKEADAITIAQKKISSWDLMEIASEKVFRWIKKRFSRKTTFVVFCGGGNNGGDGLAVARMLHTQGRQVIVYIVDFTPLPSPDFQKNLALLKKGDVPIHFLTEHSLPLSLPETKKSVVIDAIFGFGLRRTPERWIQTIFEFINQWNATIVSIDVPSGMLMDDFLEGNSFVKPDYVLTFQTPKLPLLLPQTGRYIGQWKVMDIGLDADFLKHLSVKMHLIDASVIRSLYRKRNRFAHKGDFGHGVLVGGSYGKMGAVSLSCLAALRAGVGLLTAVVPKCGYEIIQTTVAEAMVLCGVGEKHIASVNLPFEPTAIGIGVGLGTHPDTALAVTTWFKQFAHLPWVIDADAINLIAQETSVRGLIPQGAILTPHPKELERLIGRWKNDFDKMEKVAAFAQAHSVIIVVKGAHTMICNGTNFWFNATGNAGMATAGSGDVLTGILTGLLAQGYSPLQACLLGVYAHGKSGDFVAKQQGQEALIARDLIENLRIMQYPPKI